ncbi:MAG: biotin/lipoyl-containing protein [Saprospiraceae bacterium]
MKNGTYHLRINDKFKFDLTAEDADRLDAVHVAPGQFHILKAGKTHLAKVLSIDMKTRTFKMKVDGTLCTVSVKDKYDELVEKMGLNARLNHRVSNIKAPMPGLVLDVLVESGQAIAHNDPMIILEAMKMENVIKSPGEGRVKNIVVSKGNSVDKGEVLIELE